MREFYLTVLASVSHNVSFIWGPLTRAEADVLNDAIFEYGPSLHIVSGGIFRANRPFDSDGRVMVGGVCIVDNSDDTPEGYAHWLDHGV